jgi:hypothetical protein
MTAIYTITFVDISARAINSGIAINAVASVTAIVVVARGVSNIGTGDRVVAFININETFVIVVCSPTVDAFTIRRGEIVFNANTVGIDCSIRTEVRTGDGVDAFDSINNMSVSSNIVMTNTFEATIIIDTDSVGSNTVVGFSVAFVNVVACHGVGIECIARSAAALVSSGDDVSFFAFPVGLTIDIGASDVVSKAAWIVGSAVVKVGTGHVVAIGLELVEDALGVAETFKSGFSSVVDIISKDVNVWAEHASWTIAVVVSGIGTLVFIDTSGCLSVKVD